MSVREKLTAALAAAGVGNFDATWQTNGNGSPRNFVVTAGKKTFRAGTLRALLRSVRRVNDQSTSP